MSALNWPELTRQAADAATRPAVVQQLMQAKASRDDCRSRMGHLQMRADEATRQGRHRDAQDALGALRAVERDAAAWASAVVRLSRILAETEGATALD